MLLAGIAEASCRGGCSQAQSQHPKAQRRGALTGGLLTGRCPAQLYEEVCDAEGCNDIGCSHARDASAPATIMLLPPQFSVLNETRLPELVRPYPAP